MKAIIDRFRGREGLSELDKRWSAKVTDVRNWFLFAASERWREDGSEYEHYSDSGGKSGGQKEKLAYTILAASLAYQFGLEWGAVRSRSFRFVVIDEAFGRGSDDSAQYGLTLFQKLNLQLLIVTPLQKIHIIEPFVSAVGFVENKQGNSSQLQCLTIEEYRRRKRLHGMVTLGHTEADAAVHDRVVDTGQYPRPAASTLGHRDCAFRACARAGVRCCRLADPRPNRLRAWRPVHRGSGLGARVGEPGGSIYAEHQGDWRTAALAPTRFRIASASRRSMTSPPSWVPPIRRAVIAIL